MSSVHADRVQAAGRRQQQVPAGVRQQQQAPVAAQRPVPPSQGQQAQAQRERQQEAKRKQEAEQAQRERQQEAKRKQEEADKVKRERQQQAEQKRKEQVEKAQRQRQQEAQQKQLKQERAAGNTTVKREPQQSVVFKDNALRFGDGSQQRPTQAAQPHRPAKREPDVAIQKQGPSSLASVVWLNRLHTMQCGDLFTVKVCCPQ